MRIATWNVNSIRQRLENLPAWLQERQPDVVCLQETKIVDDAFPRGPLEALGYNVAIHGQKTFNGVAILSKFPFDEVTPGLPGEDFDDHARFIEAVVSQSSGVVRVASLSAERQSGRETRNIPTSCAGWTGFAAMPASGSVSKSRWCWPATTTSFPHPKTRITRPPGQKMRCSCRTTREKFRAL